MLLSRPSPYRLSICLLLKFYVANSPLEVEPPSQDSASLVKTIRRWSLTLSPLTSEAATCLAAYLLEEITDVSVIQEKSLARLLSGLSACPHTPITQALQESLKAITSPDDLVTLSAIFKEMLHSPDLTTTVDGTSVRPSHLEPDSVFGVYVRELLLDFNAMGFEGVSSLYDDLMVYVEGDDSQMMATSEPTPPTTGGANSRQLQHYLQKRALELEATMGTKTFEATEEEIQSLLAVQPELPRAQFLRYLNSTHHKELAGAIDGLHRYFDYALRRGGPNLTGKPGSSRNIVQYAVLNLASLHFHFGHLDMAMAAINETVRIAQQNGDHVCVAYALAWLHQLLVKSGDLQAEEVLFRCINRAADQHLHHLESVAALSLASFEAVGARFQDYPSSLITTPGGVRPAGGSGGGGALTQGAGPSSLSLSSTSRPRRIWNSLRMSVTAEAPPAPAAPNQPFGQPPNAAAGGASLAAALQSRDAFPVTAQEGMRLSARRCLVAAGAWEMLGHKELMVAQASRLLECYSGEATDMDVSLARIKVALARLRGSSGHDEGGSGSSGPLCVYQQALGELCRLKEAFPVSIGNVWAHCTALLLQEWALHRGETRRAYELSLMLRGLSPPDNELGIESHIEGLQQWSLVLLRTGRVHESLQVTQDLAALCERKGLPWHYVRFLLQQSSILLHACPFDPTESLPPLLRCLSFCETFDIDVVHAMATLLLAQVQLRLGAAAKARALVKATLPVLLEHAPLETQGQAWTTLAKCFLQELSSDDPSQALSSLPQVLLHLSRALAAFQLVEDTTSMREVLYLQARVYHRLSEVEPDPSLAMDYKTRRNQASQSFHHISLYMVQATQRSTSDLHLLHDLQALKDIATQTPPVLVRQ